MLTRLLFVGAFALSLSTLSFAEKVSLLSDVRKDLKLPSYTSADRELLAKQADFMISNLYVHRELKVKDFGSAIDPVPRLAELKSVAGSLSNEEFHSKIASIFSDLRDLHTNYYAPAPLACGAAFIPLRFRGVEEDSRSLVVAAQKSKVGEELTSKVAVGDELVAVDGVPTQTVIQTLSKVAAGANPDALVTRAIQLISFRNSGSHALPAKDKVVLTLKGSSGEYQVELPWFAFVDSECVENADGGGGFHFGDLLRMSVDEEQRRFNKIFSPAQPKTGEWTWFGEEALKEIFEVALLDTPTGKLGYIQLKAFSWSSRNLNVPSIIEAFRNEIEVNLASAKGILIDVRGNPGGHILLAEKLIQLFSNRLVEPGTVRMLANPLNKEIFLRANGEENRWSENIQKAINQGQRYTTPMAITPVNEANSFGQVWFRPVVVLTDASCYSACDLFTAGMQDSGSATVIGLHRRTGAGGANVMEYSTFRAIMGPANNPFLKLPYSQNMRVSWRQALRTGLHRGELLENDGVSADIIISLKRKDILHGESQELMKEVRKVIETMVPKYVSGLAIRRGGTILLANNTSAKWKEKVYGVEAIEFLVDGARIHTQTVPVTDAPNDIELDIPRMTGEWTDKNVVLLGKRNGRTVFRAVRDLRWRGEYAVIPETGLSVDFESSNIAPFHTVSLRGGTGTGWQPVEGLLRVGKGPKYDTNVLTRAFLPLKLDGKGATLVLDMALQAEEIHDSLRVYAINPDTGEKVNLYAGSALRPVRGGKMPLPNDWDKADVTFEFESDENWNMLGPVIDNVRVLQ